MQGSAVRVRLAPLENPRLCLGFFVPIITKIIATKVIAGTVATLSEILPRLVRDLLAMSTLHLSKTEIRIIVPMFIIEI